jgi:hypothetical protein
VLGRRHAPGFTLLSVKSGFKNRPKHNNYKVYRKLNNSRTGDR